MFLNYAHISYTGKFVLSLICLITSVYIDFNLALVEMGSTN
jgi:hypothetical protein